MPEPDNPVINLPEDVIKTIIAEGAGEGPEGMRAIASVMVNRAKRRGLSLIDVVNQPKQFSGRFRPDLDEFVQRQGPKIRKQAEEALLGAMTNPIPGIDHFVTTDLYESERRPFWANQMRSVGQIGNHVFFDSAKRPDGR